MNTEKLRLVVIDNPYDQMSNPLVQNLLPKVFDLKIRGYQARYDYGVLPLDSNDFVATHFIIALENKNEYQPILSYKLITYNRAKLFHLPFTPLSLMLQTKNDQHAQSLNLILENCEKYHQEISYIGSLAIDPNLKQDRSFVRFLFDLFIVFHYNYSKEFNISEGISGATVRFKTSNLIERIGYKPLMLDNRILPPIAVPAVHNDRSQFFHLSQFSEEAQNIANQYKQYWDKTLFLGMRKYNAYPKAA